ncbi:glutamate ABC transporter substrate-binding protein [Streptomyces sp. WMMC500]|uniref:glutamate ABC transporter substrate-binding protein n=1 Tax=Streptomyces sp. WMMC500 TaxID=3015154 RepID=UPI00248C53D4|nr:glutamate ABC transporter substrate-binding protein [Streptomyces sp. WMMC500]WBB64655.1 glutamate ABC transporter substrate-binding protein [Streptomyces sp. WMMC500]
MRGWGGVAGTAAAVALTAALLPGLAGDGLQDRTADDRAAAGGAVAAQPAKAGQEECESPEASLRPSASASGDGVERIVDRGYLIAGIDQNSYQWGYRNPLTGKLEGFDIDLARAIAGEILGDESKVVFRSIPTSERIPALQEKRVDVVVRTMTINCERIQEVAFSTEYFTGDQQVLAPADSDVTGFDESLDGKRVCTADGSTGQGALEEGSYGAEVMLVPNQLDCLVRLQLGEADAVVTDNALAAGQAAQDPSMKLFGTLGSAEPYGVAMNIDDEDLVRRVNKLLEDYRKDGRWKAAYEKWLADAMPGIDAPPAPTYKD